MFASDHPLHDVVDWAWKGFLCGNCTVVAANDDWSGVDPSDPPPLGKVPDGIYVIVACCDPTECDFDRDPGHVHLPDLEDGEETDCDGCGMPDEGKHPAVGDGRK
jgi:hypothetical protein